VTGRPLDDERVHSASVIRKDVDSIVDDVGDLLQALAGTTLLVTGASGFLCSWFVDTVAVLNDQGLAPACRVLAVDNHVTGLAARLAAHGEREWLRLVEHDVALPLDPGEPVDWIVHGASIASPPVYRRYPLETIAVNVDGTRNVLELARGGARGVLHLSTSEVYGDPDPAFLPTPEDYAGRVSCTGPRACYDESKRLSETLCTTYQRLYGVPVKIVRPFNVYGPGQRIDDGRIIPDLMGALVRREPIRLFSDGRATRAFCYATDAVRAMWHVLMSGASGEVFNVGNDEEEVSIGQLVDRASSIGGPPSLPVLREASGDEHYLTDNPQRRCPDLGKLRSAFPWQPRVPLADGLERTYRSYLEAA
jgi:UDP-glucuronate decarboxylase